MEYEKLTDELSSCLIDKLLVLLDKDKCKKIVKQLNGSKISKTKIDEIVGDKNYDIYLIIQDMWKLINGKFRLENIYGATLNKDNLVNLLEKKLI